MRKILAGSGIITFLILLCSPIFHQFYSDYYYPEDKIYENKSIGFLLKFRGNWVIITEAEKMNHTYKKFAKTLQRAGGELLFVGYSVEGLYGVRSTAFNLNEDITTYLSSIRELNKEEISNPTEPEKFSSKDIEMLKWCYEMNGYKFVEFFFLVDTYNIRLSFWTKPHLFTNYLPVFEDIAASLTLTSLF
ncbi:MAG: hypothetical protein N2053_07080 [Chitinispirillaceae bacterium]|nr:hypothetical protein [Chitinispirillaceae bacterium]